MRVGREKMEKGRKINLISGKGGYCIFKPLKILEIKFSLFYNL